MYSEAGPLTADGSQVACKILEGRGYRNIRRYAGGLVDWQEAGYALEGSGLG